MAAAGSYSDTGNDFFSIICQDADSSCGSLQGGNSSSRQVPSEDCNYLKLSREDKRRQRRASSKYRMAHATRERLRVEAFNSAFCTLRALLPTLPPDKKLSKIEILRLSICYISYLDSVLESKY